MTLENQGLVATATVVINVPAPKVWDALINPEKTKHYMFGATVETDWKEGSPIVWKGEWEGEAYEDKGEVLRVEPGRVIQYSHYSPLSGQPDEPENYHMVTIEVKGERLQTTVILSQDNNADEGEREHSEKNWSTMLAELKEFLER